MPSRRVLGFLIATTLATLSLTPGVARADSLTAGELSSLERGETVTRPLTFEPAGQRFVGGVTYSILKTTPGELFALLEKVDAYVEVLPRTKYAEKVWGPAPDLFVELHQGNALIDAAYTVRIRKEPEKKRVRFWLEPSRPHAIDDAWGFFRYEPLASEDGVPRILLTYGALVDVGTGMLRSLYEERLRSAMLGVPENLRRYLLRLRAGHPT
ncbi:MAG: hypothetical protein ABIP39_15735 [Polyangiaceae bacterium]